ncbi:MAG: hypothetical protein ACRD2T_00500, partial [Thermoanaerobaculia bacterium]
MASRMAESGPQPVARPGDSTSGSTVWVDRGEEAQRILEFVLAARSRLVILYGQHGVGKTSLVLRWVMPAAAADHETFYGDCELELPPEVGGRGGTCGLWEAAARRALIFIDSFERVLDLPEDRREAIFDDLAGHVLSGRCNSILVLILDKDRLGRAFTLGARLPEVAHAALEIKGIRAREGVAS